VRIETFEQLINFGAGPPKNRNPLQIIHLQGKSFTKSSPNLPSLELFNGFAAN
jgi:hypothetical protein